MHALPPSPPAYVMTVQSPGFMMVPGAGGTSGYAAPSQDDDAPVYHGQPWLVPPAGSMDQSAPAPVQVPAQPRKPGWVLVIPVDATGPRPSWGGDSAWAHQWVAPVRRDGMRFVSIMGDADDRMRMGSSMLTQPDDQATAAAALSLGRKYGTSAVAMVRAQEGGTSVYYWHSGNEPQESDSDVSPGSAKETALGLLVSLADPGKGGVPDPVPAPAADAKAAPASNASVVSEATTVDIETHPEWAQDGQMGFAVVLATSDTLRSAMLKHRMAAMSGVHVLTSDVDSDGAVITGSYEGDRGGLASALEAVGIKVAAED
jgi:hypothetical protein